MCKPEPEREKIEMEYREIPYVEKKASRIFFGTAMEPFLSGGDGSDLLDAVYEQCLRHCQSISGRGKSARRLDGKERESKRAGDSLKVRAPDTGLEKTGERTGDAPGF